MPKIRYNFTVDEDTLNLLKQLAEWNNRPVSNQLETMIKDEFMRQSTAFGAGLKKARDILKLQS